MMHLSELVRLAFIAATATSDKLKLEGLKTLQVCDRAVKLCQFLIILCKRYKVTDVYVNRLNLLSLGNCKNIFYRARPGLCWSRDTGTISSTGDPIYY